MGDDNRDPGARKLISGPISADDLRSASPALPLLVATLGAAAGVAILRRMARRTGRT